ncbi:MAG: heme exporter protein CcmD [Alteromonadaceae bacterium]|nr:heme exporter protein CcmD [Alteromonadaceae bacterium]
MQFNSFAEFLNMGGYAFYVWLSYGVSAALIVYLLFASVRRNKTVLEQIAIRQKREQRLRQAAELNMQEQGINEPQINDEMIEAAVKQSTQISK